MTKVSRIQVDGSQGEGGGQVLRSSLSLSLVTGQPVCIENVRAGREKPGLMRQHLTALRAAAEVGEAEVTGMEIGSRCLTFEPRNIQPGRFEFSIGTAGSATLVLQTILPALMFADGPSEIVLEGGTHNQWAPPYDFLESAYFPLLRKMGLQITSGLDRHGFYPAGGGRFSVGITPTERLVGLELLDRGRVVARAVTALLANLPRSIGQREVDTVAKKLDWPPACFHVREVHPSPGPGNIVN